MRERLKKLTFKKPSWLNKKAIYKYREPIIIFSFLCLIATAAYAGKVPISMSMDARVKKVTYHANEVYRLKGHYGYSSTIEFDSAETIETISLGDSEAWQVVKPQRKNILFIKPLEQNAATNMTVITSKRIYSFDLSAEQMDDINSNNLTFLLKFIYNDKPKHKNIVLFDNTKKDNLSSVSPEEWNFEYSFTGDQLLRPQRVFDDGKFTYFQFDENIPLPAVFIVDDKGKESIVNSSLHGTNLVVHKIGAEFKLRDGDYATSIFNDAWALPTGKERDIVPLTSIKDRSTKRKKRNSFFASVTPSKDKFVYNN